MLTLNMIAFELGYKFKLIYGDMQDSVENLFLLDPKFESRFNKNLYVSKLSDYMKLTSFSEGDYYICLIDCDYQMSKLFKAGDGLLLIEADLSVYTLFNKIHYIFNKIENWSVQMNRVLAENRGFQGLLNCSEEILGNHVDIMDASFNLLAYTKNVHTDDFITNELLKNKTHSNEILKKFSEVGRYVEYGSTPDVIVSRDHLTSDYTVLKKVFHHNTANTYYVVLICQHRSVDPGYLDLFRMFLSYVQVQIARNTEYLEQHNELFHFLHGLLTKEIPSKDEVINKASFLNFPIDNYYYVLTLNFADTMNVPLDRIAADINTDLYYCTAIVYKKRIVVIQFCYGDLIVADGLKARVEQINKSQPCNVGVSNIYDDICMFQEAYEQSICALECGIRVQKTYMKNGLIEKLPLFYHFEDYYLELMLSHAIAGYDVLNNSFVGNAVKILRNAGSEKSTDLVELLDVYFEMGGRATDAAKALYIHRNTLLYYLKKIEELLGISLEDPTACLKLQLALKMEKSGISKLFL